VDHHDGWFCQGGRYTGRQPKGRECWDVDVVVVEGDLLDQPVDVIVNAWNRNVGPAASGPSPSP
jgi:hypothetical protein